MNKKEALELIGGLSSPSKMPCYSYSIPAQKCITGMKLRNVANSICSKCYALKGMYGFPVVKAALQRRFESLTNELWVNAMVISINAKEKSGFFRWHDSGDIQSVEHLLKIVEVCLRTPNIIHWLPTREYGIVGDYLKSWKVPPNLTIRLSALMLEASPPTSMANRFGLVTSGVSKVGFTCPAPNQDNKCGSCRACWNKNVPNINYKQH
jgi:Gene product 88